MSVDYKKLFEKYVVVVGEYDGHLYISEFKDSGLPYTDEEIAEIWRLQSVEIKNGKLFDKKNDSYLK